MSHSGKLLKALAVCMLISVEASAVLQVVRYVKTRRFCTAHDSRQQRTLHVLVHDDTVTVARVTVYEKTPSTDIMKHLQPRVCSNVFASDRCVSSCSTAASQNHGRGLRGDVRNAAGTVRIPARQCCLRTNVEVTMLGMAISELSDVWVAIIKPEAKE